MGVGPLCISGCQVRRALERSLTFVYMALTSIFGIARHPINN